MCQNQASDQIPVLSDQHPFQIQVPLGAVKLPHKRVSDLEKPHEGEEGQAGPRQPLTSLTPPQAEMLRPVAACQHSLGPQRSPRPTTVKPPVHSLGHKQASTSSYSPDLQSLLA